VETKSFDARIKSGLSPKKALGLTLAVNGMVYTAISLVVSHSFDYFLDGLIATISDELVIEEAQRLRTKLVTSIIMPSLVIYVSKVTHSM
jgi:hypothetical protein